jgi:hypothetical protein
MGILKLFSSEPDAKLSKLPSGSFTVDASGRVLTSTLPRWFSAELTVEISQEVLASFRAAQKAHLPLSELVLHYASIRITARELRGGAIVFVAPQVFHRPQH